MGAKTALGLPNKVEGMTYADGAKYIDGMFEGRNDVISLRTKETLMARLRDAQEMEREKMQKTAPQGQRQLRYGGEEEGVLGTNENQDSYTLDPDDPFTTAPDDIEKYYGAETETMEEGTPYDTSIEGTPEGTKGFFGQAGDFLKENKTGVIGGIGLAANILGPMLANRRARKDLKAPDTLQSPQMNLGMISPNFVNRQQIERNLANQAATSRQSVSQMGLSQSQLAASQGNIHRGTSQSLANAMLQADLADTQEKTRVQQGRVGLEQYNQQQQFQTDQLNLQNKTRYEDQLASLKQAGGANIGAIGKSMFNYMQASNLAKETGKSGIFEAILASYRKPK